MLQIGAAFFYYKLGQTLLKPETASFYKVGQVLLQIGAAITNKGNRYYKIGKLLQIGKKCITNWGRYYK